MSRRLTSFLRRSKGLVLVAAMILLTGMGTLLAQNPNSTAGMLDRILTAVGVLQTSVDAAASTVNYRFTPPLAGGGSFQCDAVNITNTPLHIEATLFDSAGIAVDTNVIAAQPPLVAPGGTTGLGTLSLIGAHYCKFRVTDPGMTKANFRGSISHVVSPIFDDMTLPAE